MAKGVTIKLNRKGVGELLKSSEIMGLCEEVAGGVAGRAEGSWEVKSGVGAQRAYASVSTQDRETYFRNLNTNTLLKALGGGGK